MRIAACFLMNDSARAIPPRAPADGKAAFRVNRSQTLLDTVEKAIAEGARARGCGRTRILLTASTVRHNEGLVVLLQDVTERNASRRRASVHRQRQPELRTPLTISGYAELIQRAA